MQLLPTPSLQSNRNRLLLTLVVTWMLALGAAMPAQAQTYASTCAVAGCHAGQAANDPNLGRVNAANAPAMIQRAAVLNGMGVFNLATRTAIANEIGGLVTQTQADNINYGATKSFNLNNLHFGGVIDQLVQISGPTVTPSVVGATGSFSYTHSGGAGGNCTTQNVVVVGRGTTDFGFGVPAADTSNRTVTITINPPAAPTTAAGNTALAYSTSAQSINLAGLGLVTGTPAGSSTTVALGTPSPNIGTVAATGPSTFTYASSPTIYAPTVNVSYTVTGPCSTTATTRTFTINVNAPPAPSVSNAGPFSVPSVGTTNNVTTLTSTGIVQNSNGDPFNFNIASQPPAGQGTVSLSGTNNSVVNYTASGTYTGTTSFTYTRTGPGGTSVAATVTLDVTAAPIVSTSSVTTAFNTAVPVNVAPLVSGTFTSVNASAPVNGTVGVVGSTVTFTPTGGFFGTGSFQYTATGPGGTSAPATITVTVNPPAPTASPGNATVPYQTATVINLAPFISPSATVTSVTPSGPVNGTVSATSATTVTFTPTAGFVGAASFNYTATNVAGTSGSATVSVTVSPPAAPVAGAASGVTGVGLPIVINLGSTVSGIFTSVAIASLPTRGLVTLSGNNATYTPAAGFQGSDSFTYTATGPGGTSAAGTVLISVISAPSIANLSATTPFNTAVTIDVGSAISGQVNSFALSSLPTNGTAIVNGSSVVYTPKPGFFGMDAFTVIANGPGGSSGPVVVQVTVTPPPPGPAGTPLTVNTAFGSTLTFNLGASVSSVATSFTLSQPPQGGTVVINGTQATYTPNPGFSGTDSFSVIPRGPGGVGAETFITVMVGTLAPSARAASMSAGLNQPVTIDVASLISGSGITGVNVVGKPAHGTVEVFGTKLTYTPRQDFFGTDTFTYVAFGNAGTSSPATVSVTITSRPDPTQNPGVMGMAAAQGQATARFAAAQQSTIRARLENLRGGLAVSSGEESADKPVSLRPRSGHPAVAANRATGVTVTDDPFAPLQAGEDARTPAMVSGQGRGAAQDSGLPPSLVGALIGLATGRSLDLGSATGSTGAGRDSGWQVWVGGNVQFGRRDATANTVSSKFTTDGVSLGVDRRFGPRWVGGLAMGYAHDETDVGADGSRLKARGTSTTLYAGVDAGRGIFLDGLLGAGKVDLDSRRWVASQDAFADTRRKADQLFGSLVASYEWRRDALLVSPYGRLDFTRDRLKDATETGAGVASLAWLAETRRSTQAAVGVRLEIQHPTEFGWVKPRARLEYRHEFESGRDVTVAYADQLASGPRYGLSAAGQTRSALVAGFGADFFYRNGLKLGIDYQAVRIKGPESSQSIRFLLSQDLDFKALPDNAVAWNTGKDAIRVEAGYSWDDNVTRSRSASSKYADGIAILGLGYGRFFPLGSNSRFAASAFFSGEKFRRYPGLGSASAGLQGEYQYRTSASFDATTFGLFARVNVDEFESRQRDGARYALGLNARRAITDRIDIFGELSGTVRNARSAVFDRREVGLRGNVDYALSKRSTIYVTGEFRRGDLVSTGTPSLESLNVAEVLVQDDAFDGSLFSYRAEGRSIIGTLGWNYSVGPRDSIDFSVRRAEARPLQGPGFQVQGAFKYVANQYSIIYLTRF